MGGGVAVGVARASVLERPLDRRLGRRHVHGALEVEGVVGGLLDVRGVGARPQADHRRHSRRQRLPGRLHRLSQRVSDAEHRGDARPGLVRVDLLQAPGFRV